MSTVLHFVPEPGGECCDFCTARPVSTTYACHNFVWNKEAVFAHESIGAWAACEKCAAFIDAGKWASLTERALRRFVKKHHVPRHEVSAVWAQLSEIHQLFREHMMGES